jgi:hypothetical protein
VGVADELELFEDPAGKLRWHLRSSDGEIVASGEVSMAGRLFAGMSDSTGRAATSAVREDLPTSVLRRFFGR